MGYFPEDPAGQDLLRADQIGTPGVKHSKSRGVPGEVELEPKGLVFVVLSLGCCFFLLCGIIDANFRVVLNWFWFRYISINYSCLLSIGCFFFFFIDYDSYEYTRGEKIIRPASKGILFGSARWTKGFPIFFEFFVDLTCL